MSAFRSVPQLPLEAFLAWRAHVEANRAAVDALLAQLNWIAERAAGMRSAMAGDADDTGDLRDARRTLHSAIRDAVKAEVRGGCHAPQAEHSGASQRS